MACRSEVTQYLLLNKHLAALYTLIAYISWQLHELGHWIACKVLGIDAIFGFNEWKIVSSYGPFTLAIVAGPLTNLILAVTGLALICFASSLAARIGLFLLLSNTFIDIGAALVSIKHVVAYPSLQAEPTWKLVLIPAFVALTYVGLKAYREKLRLRTLLVMAALTAVLAAASIPMDIATWSCIERGMPICSPVAGISAIVVVVNVVVAIITVTYVAMYREELKAIKLRTSSSRER